jgi:hypothetical protein
MAAVGAGNPTLLDVIKRTNPDGMIADVVEALAQRNPILMDATVMEGNLPTGHRHTIRTGLPSVGWRQLNDGIVASKSKTIQVDEACGLLEGRSVVDCELARLNGNEASFRASEDMSFVQSMNNTAAEAIFHASTAATPEKIHGLTPRFNNYVSGGNKTNIVPCDTATGNQYSMWFVTWSPETCFLMYPKGMKGGLEHIDMGREYEDGTTGKFLAWRSHWIWRLGLSVRDWRYVVRVCNIDPDVSGGATTSMITAMVKAHNRLHDLNTGRLVIYAARGIVELLDLQIMQKANVWFGTTDWHGHKVSSFRGIPIIPCDALATAETAVALT